MVLMLDCPDLSVPKEVMQHVVHVESSRNPFAIGVVGGYLARQPKSLDEALAAVRQLKEEGYNFSVGIAQVNRYNLAKYGLNTYVDAFDVCSNLRAGSRILRECYDRAQDWGKAFSCYYSGNFATGFKHGYVQKIFASIQKSQTIAQAPEPIRIIPYSNAPRKQSRDDTLPLVAEQWRESQSRSYPEPQPIRQALLNSGHYWPTEAAKLRLSSSSVMRTAEHRAAIPVPGPGAVMQGEEKNALELIPTGIQHIPTQLVGVDGNPYQTRLLSASASEAGRQQGPSLPDHQALSPRGIQAALPVRFDPRRIGAAPKGGAIVHGGTAEISEANSTTLSDPAPSGDGSVSKKPGSSGDQSFVF
jgi:type IV secretion system protein VirB1